MRMVQSLFASGGWNSLACFAAFTPYSCRNLSRLLSGLEGICAPADLPPPIFNSHSMMEWTSAYAEKLAPAHPPLDFA